MRFDIIDIIVFTVYCVLIVTIGLLVSREKKGVKKSSKDYFLASKALPWWAVGASLIASNISAEQFIGMSGSGFAIGLGIASYEWLAAITLIIVAVFFLPIYLKKGIYTMPQFLEERFDRRVKTVMAIFWLLVFIFVNLTSILYLGSLAIYNMMGVDLVWGMLFLAVFSAIYSIYGGLKAVAWTDVIQVVFLIAGGIITTYVAFNILGNGSVVAGMNELWEHASYKFDLIIEKGVHMVPDGKGGVKDAYLDLPGLGVLVGGLWVANLYYWGCNQYIIQRALASKSIDEAQKGLIFASFIKFLLPMIVVVPGMIAFVMYSQPELFPEIASQMTTTVNGVQVPKSDNAYPVLLSLIPSGIRGVAFAALVAAIVSSLASMMNSISSIFTMDIYHSYFNKKASETSLVRVGRISSVVALAIAAVVAPMLSNLDQAFQYIQEFTGFVSPGALAIFLTGFFYKRATANGALLSAIATFIFSGLFFEFLPEVPFIDRMLYVFLICIAIIIITAKIENKGISDKAIDIDKSLFKTSRGFKLSAFIIIVIVVALYAIWW